MATAVKAEVSSLHTTLFEAHKEFQFVFLFSNIALCLLLCQLDVEWMGDQLLRRRISLTCSVSM